MAGILILLGIVQWIIAANECEKEGLNGDKMHVRAISMSVEMDTGNMPY